MQQVIPELGVVFDSKTVECIYCKLTDSKAVFHLLETERYQNKSANTTSHCSFRRMMQLFSHLLLQKKRAPKVSMIYKDLSFELSSGKQVAFQQVYKTTKSPFCVH